MRVMKEVCNLSIIQNSYSANDTSDRIVYIKCTPILEYT